MKAIILAGGLGTRISEETDSKTSNSDKHRLAPPKKKNHGPAKAHLAADAQLTAEDAYDYEL